MAPDKHSSRSSAPSHSHRVFRPMAAASPSLLSRAAESILECIPLSLAGRSHFPASPDPIFLLPGQPTVLSLRSHRRCAETPRFLLPTHPEPIPNALLPTRAETFLLFGIL